MGAKFVVVSGHNPGHEYHLLTDRSVMGRSDEADIVLMDRSVSRKHIEIFRDGVGFTVRDLGSGNGTFLNGSRIREAELVGGDRVELGSHVLEFYEQPPSRHPNDRQVVYRIDRGDQPRPAPAPQAAPPSQPGQLQVPVPKKVIAAPPAHARRRPQKAKRGVAGWLIALLITLFVGLAGAVTWVFVSKTQTEEPAPVDPTVERLAQGQSALERMAWVDAQEHFSAILQNDPNNQAASDGLSVASTEQRYADLMNEAERLISVGEYNHAIVNLRSVIAESQRQSAIAQSRLDRLFDELVTEGRAAVDRSDLGAAEAFASVVLEAQPQHRSAAALLDEIEVVRGQQEAVASAGAAEEQARAEEEDRSSRRGSRRSSRDRDRDDRRSSRRSSSDDDDDEDSGSTPVVAAVAAEERRPTRSSRDDDDDPDEAFSRGWREYRNGDFEAAASFFEDYASSHGNELGDQAVQHAERIRSFADAFVPGRESYDTGDYDVAVADLRRAYSLDRRLEEAYRATIAEMLANSYYHLAQADYGRGEYRDAGENARIALRYDDRHADTRALVRNLEERANELYIDAVSFRESNPERARQLCRDIENMLPDSSELHRRATELREQL